MPAVKYGIFIENTFISYILQALVRFHRFLSDLITTIAIFVCKLLPRLYPNCCHEDALTGKCNKTLGRGSGDRVFSLQA